MTLSWQSLRRASIFTAVLSLLGCFSAAANAQRQLQYKDLQTLAREAIDKQEVAIDPPDFEPRNGVLPDNLGYASFVIDPSQQDFDLLTDVILREQFGVEAIRKHQSKPDQKAFWQTYLARVETVIARQLAAFQDGTLSEDERFAKVLGMKEEIQSIYLQARSDLATRLGVRLEQARAVRSPRTVEFVTNPGGARIFVTHAIEERIAKLQGRRPNWRVIPNPQKVQLEGKYRYLIQWPDRTAVGASYLQVDHDGRYLLQ